MLENLVFLGKLKPDFRPRRINHWRRALFEIFGQPGLACLINEAKETVLPGGHILI